ncbi:MAG: GGDEF domain-containing protein [Spirochaetes bacterium]|jgi:diguanylate cyclase (GGDEF)-like protein|nr:GGDEF domain-containing protein [Spirochaetota bacterium]
MNTEKDIDEIKLLLKNIDIFSSLKDEELAAVASYSDFYPFSEGEVVFSEGRYCENLFMIKEGSVRITRKNNGTNEIDIAKFIKGESFGELDLFENSPMSATALAEKDTVLLMFPYRGASFRDVLVKRPDISAHIIYKLIGMIAGRIRSTNKLISEQTPWIKNLKRQLLSDKLTGLYNRSFLEDDLPKLLPEYGPSTCIAMVKPDNFKEINDGFGHEAGDNVLRLLADTVKSCIRDDDIAVRYRGDEFAVVLPSTGTEEALGVAEVIIGAVKSMCIDHLTPGRKIIITASIGIAACPDDDTDPKSLVGTAHKKMFEARDGGGDRIKA